MAIGAHRHYIARLQGQPIYIGVYIHKIKHMILDVLKMYILIHGFVIIIIIQIYNRYMVVHLYLVEVIGNMYLIHLGLHMQLVIIK